jgi:hypothetical protein
MAKYILDREEAGFFGIDLPRTELNIASRGQVVELEALVNAGNLAFFSLE